MSAHPVLVSATVGTGADAGAINACFDKTIGNTISAGAFHLAGYRAANNSAALTGQINRSATNCVALTAIPGDYTILEAAANAVHGNASGQGNYADSVALTGASSFDGTQGITTGPDLVGVLSPAGASTDSRLTFVFDKGISLTPVKGGLAVFYYTQLGQPVRGHLGHGLGHNVGGHVPDRTDRGQRHRLRNGPERRARFRGPAGGQKRLGFRLVQSGHVGDRAAPGQHRSDVGSGPHVGRPGQQWPGGHLHFDKPVTVINPTSFSVALANGQELQGMTATANGQTVTVSFPTLGSQYEFAVSASAQIDAASVVNNSAATNVPIAVPIGANAGASGLGFTTAPDVFGITINHSASSASTVVVNLDDRVNPAIIGNPQLYDAAGSPLNVGTPTVTPSSANPGPGPESITFTYPPASLTTATSAGFAAGAFAGVINPTAVPTNGATADTNSVAQLVGTTNTAAILTALRPSPRRKQAKAHTRTTHHAQTHPTARNLGQLRVFRH